MSTTDNNDRKRAKKNARRQRTRVKKDWEDLPWYRKVIVTIFSPCRYVASTLKSGYGKFDVFKSSDPEDTKVSLPRAILHKIIAFAAVGFSAGLLVAKHVILGPFAVLFSILSVLGIAEVGSNIWNWFWPEDTVEVGVSTDDDVPPPGPPEGPEGDEIRLDDGTGKTG